MMDNETMQALAAHAADISNLQQKLDRLEKWVEEASVKLELNPPEAVYYNEPPTGGLPGE